MFFQKVLSFVNCCQESQPDKDTEQEFRKSGIKSKSSSEQIKSTSLPGDKAKTNKLMSNKTSE